MLEESIGFLGTGQMARALAQAFVKTDQISGDRIWGSDPMPESLDEFRRLVPGAHASSENADVARSASVIFLAVKPQHINPVLADIQPHVGPDKLVVSIAAGVRISQLAAGLKDEVRLVRVMPNTPCLVGQGASAYCLGPHVIGSDKALVDRLLSTVGLAYCLDEKLLDAVTGLSGSGPGFICSVIEALSDGGVRMGLPHDVASALAAQTVRGTGKLVMMTGEPPAVVKDRVASPGGTTIAGLKALEEHGLRAALMAAVQAATDRSVELGSE